jgi:small subunit ribosomal protein S16
MLKIRLNLRGKKNQKTFRLVVIDGRKQRESKNFVTDLGFYNPHTKEIQINKIEALKWIEKGAQPTKTVLNLIKKVSSASI